MASPGDGFASEWPLHSRTNSLKLTSQISARLRPRMRAGKVCAVTMSSDGSNLRVRRLFHGDSGRAEELRVGKEGVSTCSTRWSQDNEKNNTNSTTVKRTPNT